MTKSRRREHFRKKMKAVSPPETIGAVEDAGRFMREVPTGPKRNRRFICSQCLWDAEVPRAELASETVDNFQQHDCAGYRRRDSYS
jgi:hypothetical protein